MRLNKFLAQNDIGSRRECDKLITKNGVFINGIQIKDPAYNVEETQTVIYEGKEIKGNNDFIIIAMNKPRFYLTSKASQGGKKTVFELLPKKYENLKYIGRLDYESRGLLLFTNKGFIADFLTSPENKIPKTYKIITNKELNSKEINQLANGVFIENNYKTKPAIVKKNSSKNYNITISEGKKRQVRYMVKAVGARVIDLQRIRINDLVLDDLNIEQGKYRILNKNELIKLNKKILKNE